MISMNVHSIYDCIIIGAGVSGSVIAQELALAGKNILVLEAGNSFTRTSYPRKEIDANSQLYWGGGAELNMDASLTFLRPKVVGGGSIVNQALMDHFDSNAFESWKKVSGVSFFDEKSMAPWYEKAEQELIIQTVPETFRNGNAEIFAEGFKKNGYICAPLKRAQRDCQFEKGNDCIECLAGCPIDSKQSMAITTLKKALEAGAKLISKFEVTEIISAKDLHKVSGILNNGAVYSFAAKKIVMASGAIGNSKLLLRNKFKSPAIGKGFYTHPQYMILGLYDKKIDAFRGPLQSYKSNDPSFRQKGFKLENVFAPPVAISMLIPHIGMEHMDRMKKITQMACIEVAVRDTNPGTITLAPNGRAIINKSLNAEDLRRKKAGTEAIYSIFESTGVKEIIPGNLGIGLHLMGGCAIGTNAKTSVVNPDFQMHDHPNIYIADSSIFPDAPGINPSLTIMALSKMAAAKMLKEMA
jgi:choline dehydrogenase-like flavoprotein